MKWKLYSVFLISLIIIPAGYNKIKSCASGYDAQIDEISLFDVSHPSFEKYRAFLPNMFDYGFFEYGRANEDSLNLNEWSAYFKKSISRDSIHGLLYSVSLDQLETLLKNPKAKLYKDALNYFIQLRDSATQFKRDPESYSWEYHPEINSIQYISATNNCKERFAAIKNPFLKQRYGYLVLRLLRFNQQYDACIDWYVSTLSKLKLNGTLKYRSLQYYAGALYHKEKYAEANYYFSRIFDEYPARAGQAAYDFRPNTMDDWIKTLSLAKNTREKEVLYFLNGRLDPMQALKNISALNPTSEYIPVLLKRLVNNIEDATIEVYRTGPGMDFSWYSENGPPDNSGNCYACVFGSEQMAKTDNREIARVYINKKADQANLFEKNLWIAAAAYTNLLMNKTAEANALIERLAKSPNTSSDIHDEIKILQTIYSIKTTTHINSDAELNFHTILTQPEVNKQKIEEYGSTINSVNNYCMQLISDAYLRQGDSLKAELCSRTNHLYYKYNTRIHLDNMRVFQSGKAHSVWEEYLINNYIYKLPSILESIATIKLYEHKFEEALKALNSIEQYNAEQLYGDPFIIHIKDCHDCDFELPQKIKYTKKTFIEKMVTLANLSGKENNLKKKSELCFEYANGLYNMSYAGNARLLSESMITYLANVGSYSIDENNDPAEFKNDFYELYNNCSEAEKWYAKALNYSSDTEFKARCTWMMAKCQLQNFYNSQSDTESSDTTFEFDAYKLLKNNYSYTDYYKAVIKECEYFRNFAARDN